MDLLTRLRQLLRAPVEPERMLRSVASLLAVEIGQYCIADVMDRTGTVRRLGIEHADPSLRARLLVACEDAELAPEGRVARLFRAGGAELVARVSEATAARQLGDIRLLKDERVRSYMAASVVVSGAPWAVLTLAATHGTRRYDEGELSFLEGVAEWVGLGIENALRREAQPRASVAPPADDDAAPASRRSSRLGAHRS